MNKEEMENKLKGVCQDCIWLEKIEPIFNTLQQENKQLKEELDKYKWCNPKKVEIIQLENLQQELDKYKHNWKELKEYIESEIAEWQGCECMQDHIIEDKAILDIMRELEDNE